MELNMQSIHMNRVKCRETFQQRIDDDVNVPDQKPDVRAIVWKNATVRMTEKKLSKGRLNLKGALVYHVLYLSDDPARQIRSLRGEIPFDESAELSEDCAGDSISVRTEVCEFQVGMIHSRKLSVHAEIAILAQTEELHDIRAAVGLKGEGGGTAAAGTDLQPEAGLEIPKDGAHLHTRMRVIPVTSIAADKKDTARLREELFLPSGKESVAELLFWELELCHVEAKPREEAIEVRGELSMLGIWQSEREEGEPEYLEAILPFKTEFEISGCREGMIENVTFRLTNESVSVRSDEDGENRMFVAEGVLEAEMKLYEEAEMEILSDFYAQDCLVTPVYAEEEYENLLMKNESRMRLAKHLVLPEGMPDILQICRGRAEIRPDVCVRDGEALRLSGTVEAGILYYTGEDERPLMAYQTSIPFEHRIELRGLSENSTYDVQCQVVDTSFGTVRNREAELKTELAFSVFATEKCRERVIVGENCEEFEEERLENLPSMIGYTVKPGEELWDIAKRFFVAEEEILRLGEHGAQLREGEQLLIVKTVAV